MTAKMKKNATELAIEKVNENGMLLVFPVNNRPTPKSIWSEFYPRTKLKWEWDDTGDQKVFKMWQMMKELSTGRDIIYSKWYSGRATFFSKELFTSLLSRLRHSGVLQNKLSMESRALLSELESDSPLSTRDLKKLTGLQGKLNEGFYNQGIKDLFAKLLIVGFGEVDDGAFPSLAVGATQHIYEDLWLQSQSLSDDKARTIVEKFLPEGSEFRKYFNKICRENDLNYNLKS